MTLEKLSCCGIAEYDGLLNDPEENLRRICSDRFSYENGAYIVFSDIRACTRGKSLVKLIKKHKLGTIISPRARVNPNSGNKLKMWIWSPNDRLLKKWYNKQDRHIQPRCDEEDFYTHDDIPF